MGPKEGKKGWSVRRDEGALITASVVMLLVAAWLSLPVSPPPGGLATSDYVTATRAYDEAVATGDASKATDWVTGDAVIALRTQLATDSQEGLVIKTTRSPSRFELRGGTDGAPSLVLLESGIERLDIAQAPGNTVLDSRERTYTRAVTIGRNGAHYRVSSITENSAPAGWLDLWGLWLARALLILGAIATAIAALTRHRHAGNSASRSEPVGSQPKPIAVRPAEPVATQSIVCFGGLAIHYHGSDLTPRLLARRVIAFIWVYLLALELQRPGFRMTRAALAAEVFPGLPGQTQRERLRDRLRDIRTNLPDPLANCVVQGTDAIGFDPTGWTVDALDLREVAKQVRSEAPETIAGGSADVEQRWSGTLLQEWEDLEKVTEGRGASHDLITDLRFELEGMVVEVSTAAAARLLVLGDAAAAVRIAERASTLRPDREDVHHVLARAYAQAGRHNAAADAEI